MNEPTLEPFHKPEVLILGSGIAGLTAALHFAEFASVTLLAKDRLEEGNSRYAQGGIAAVWSEEDTPADHIDDTIKAGAGLCNSEIVKKVVEDGPEQIRFLLKHGAKFEPDLHQEGGHQKRRILHAHDSTGLMITEALIKSVKENPHIRVLEFHMGVDLIMEGKIKSRKVTGLGRCLGSYVLDITKREIFPIAADLTILATGGAGKAYLYTSNPDVATGDGIAMAARAGAQISNMEFMQFHPTCLYHPHAKNFLITEAIRGEGAILRTLDGKAFMKNHHPLQELAPRDIVARAIDLEMKRTGAAHVYLDASHLSEEIFQQKFPAIYARCRQYGIHPPKDMIPVVPAAHYLCGGVQVDEFGRSSIDGLAAIGEASHTGLHGANRLASNSLLEGIVFAKRLSDHFQHEHVTQSHPHDKNPRVKNLPVWDFGRAVDIEEQIDIAATWREIRTLMWNYVGIVRSNRRLSRAKDRLSLIRHEVNHDYWKFKVTRDLIELRNLLTVSELIVESALRRRESRGLHYNVDYPNAAKAALDTVI
jgi:L-aspartate oxidase